MTDSDKSSVSRRTVLKTGTVFGAAGILGWSVLGSASAQIQTGMFSVDNIEVDSESGVLESLVLENINVFAEWEHFDDPAVQVDWLLTVKHDGDVAQDVRSASMSAPGDFSESLSGSVTASMDSLDILGDDTPWTPQDFSVPSSVEYDGEAAAENFGLSFELYCVIEDADGDSLDKTVTGGANVGITNLPAIGSHGGEGELNATDSGDGGSGGNGVNDFSEEVTGDAGTLSAFMLGNGDLKVKSSQLDQNLQNWDDTEDEISMWFDGGIGSGTEVKVSYNPSSGNVEIDSDPDGVTTINGNSVHVDVASAGYTTFGATASLVVGAQANTVQTNLTKNGNKAWESGARFDLTQ